jgi:hypothetical protein
MGRETRPGRDVRDVRRDYGERIRPVQRADEV